MTRPRAFKGQASPRERFFNWRQPQIKTIILKNNPNKRQGLKEYAILLSLVSCCTVDV
jgi:hypothetical protein